MKRNSKWKTSNEGSSNTIMNCYECNGVGHLKRECPNNLRGKGKVMNATLSNSGNSSSESDDDVDEDGNYTAFMAISSVNAISHLEEINEDDDGDLEVEPTESKVAPETDFNHYQFSDNKDEEEREDLVNLQQNYDALLKVSEKYA